MKSLGADVTLDYRESDLARKIKAAIPTAKNLMHAFDCVGVEPLLFEEVVDEGGTLALALPPTRQYTKHHAEMAITGCIHDLETFKTPHFKFHEGNEPRDSPGAKRLRDLMDWTMKEVGRRYQPPNVRRLSGKGMYDAFEAFELLRANQISAEKVVWKMANTPGL